ncbi:uncharacterized protein LOC117180648 [Belonocnema kinseyi]|uniref:uncharacterized protein LOC117180648 n=1 Tax=Belonocnema kinseyi TaxID=2817044 RepID=UPI00143D6451|nr:uncharacterized protein LOC117180648 [Belonocnema kinseyi]
MAGLQRKILAIESTCYRYSDSEALFEEEMLEGEKNSINAESDIIDVKLEKDESSTRFRYKHSFYVHRDFLRDIVGKYNKKLEALNLQYVRMPRDGNGPIMVMGSCGRDVVLARHKIDQIVNRSQYKNEFTHVLDYPITSEDIINRFNEFKAKVMKDHANDSTELKKDFFQLETQLHIKTKVLWLSNNNMIERAVLALHACNEEIIQPFLKKNGPLTIEISGIECGQVDTTKAKELYAKVVDEKGHLLALSQKIVDYFAELGLMKRNKYKKIIELRMAIMKTSFLLRKIENSQKKTAIHSIRKTKFDATKIVEEHKDTYFGKITLSTMHLSIRRYEDGFDRNRFAAKIDF